VHPVRLAISGVSYGPGLFELMELLGRERVVARMKTAAERIEKGTC
jgi:glutamyl-tRNA synthetase